MTRSEQQTTRRNHTYATADNEYREGLSINNQNDFHAGVIGNGQNPGLRQYERQEVSQDADRNQVEEEMLWWDSFKCTLPRQKSGSMAERRGYEVLLRLVKLLVYSTLFLLILGGGLIAQACLLLALSGSRISSTGTNSPSARLHCGPEDDVFLMLQKSTPSGSSSRLLTWRWVVLGAFTVPELLGLLCFLWSCLFVELRMPRGQTEWARLGLLSIIEAAHALGLALAFLVGMPELEPLQVLVCLNCVYLVPALLGLVSEITTISPDVDEKIGESSTNHIRNPKIPVRNSQNTSTASSGAMMSASASALNISVVPNILALFCQIGGLSYLGLLAWDQSDNVALWILPPSLLLCSVRWWGNYLAHDTRNSRNGLMKYLTRARNGLQMQRSVFLGYTCLLRLTVFTVSAYAIARLWLQVDSNQIFESFWAIQSSSFAATRSNATNNNRWSSITMNQTLSTEPQQRIVVHLINGLLLQPMNVAIVHAVCGIVVYSCARFACKTLMQGFALGVALQLVSPVALVCLSLLAWFSKKEEYFDQFLRSNTCDSLPDQWKSRRLVRLGMAGPQQLLFELVQMGFFQTNSIGLNENDPLVWLVLPVCITLLLLFSRFWLTRHVVLESNECLASTERIFSVSTYDALLLDQSIALAKWRKHPRDFDYQQLDDLASDEEAQLRMSRRKMALSSTKERDRVTRIYACATMWHESPEEMRDFLNSILRLDRDQCILRVLQKHYHIRTPDYYELEVHIFFDDAFRCARGCVSSRVCGHDENLSQVNDWVLSFVQVVEEAVTTRKLRPQAPFKYPAPYGGRLLYLLPEGNRMYVHLKDRNRIRTRKRWSQVMYMYYLLGYRLMELPISVERKEVIAENTYILTLDGDIDFRPSAVRALVDRMKINRDLGSVCSRIHPLGSGPMVWFQKFEYAVGHWLQKATEHTIGSVLCSPGCFALFRANALMDYDVMRKYATIPSEAHHFIQYDQGEDRWLCTLLLQRGYKVEYSAASDAYTHAPETFNEFYVQRRRWIPSTVANIVDLLNSAKETRAANRDISSLFVCYQWILMGSTVLGPGTIFLMLVGSFVAAFRIDNWTSFSYNLVPVLTFCLVCYFCKERLTFHPLQLAVACVITIMYSLVMVVVLVGVMVQISEDGLTAPSSLLFFAFVGEFIVTGLLHPLELGCLAHGPIYFITVPSMYMLLIIFSLFNMNNVTWGTRDVPKVETNLDQAQSESHLEVRPSSSTLQNGLNSVKKLFGNLNFNRHSNEPSTDIHLQIERVSDSLTRVQAQVDDLHRNLKNPGMSTEERDSFDTLGQSANQSSGRNVSFAEGLDEQILETAGIVEDTQTTDNGVDKSLDDGSEIEDVDSLCGDTFLVSPNWIKDKKLGNGLIDHLDSKEEDFWKKFIHSYLEPIDKDANREAQIAEKVTKLRNQNVFKFFMINCLFGLTIFLMQLKKDLFHLEWPIGVTYNITYSRDKMEVYVNRKYLRLEPIGCLFVVAYLGVLVIQFIAMLFHRFETFSHIMAKVSLEWRCCNKRADLSEEARKERIAAKITKKLRREVDTDSEDTWREQRRLIPPRKRMTVHQTFADVERDFSYAHTFSRKLENDLQLAGPYGVRNPTSRSQLGLQISQRQTIPKEQFMNQHSDLESYEKMNQNDSSLDASPIGPSSRRNLLHRTYDNPAFIPE
ncbi:hypothetical protein QAD02_024116 [Eretmocerus hayati]|uniref:Uncharacterized protein n=1 Tax=Eretmocerus hayati TaxID=131215 RepID=A0ACC2PZI7_9HYME|nr:hypothetical protein QAD02_024116 [Eretmocerus hayati]